MKQVIITGASGLVATELSMRLLAGTDYKLYLISTDVSKIQDRYKEYGDKIVCCSLETFDSLIEAGLTDFDVCIHTAFSRSSKGGDIAASLEFERTLLTILKKTRLGVFVNISSQSVYGKISEPLWTEDYPVDPDYLYALGKYSSEVLTRSMLENTSIRWTNIRLCSVCENARFVRIFVQNALEGKPIRLTAPDQHCSFIDVRDVASGLVCLIEKSESMVFEPVYNLGANLICSIKDIAQKVKAIGEKKYGIDSLCIKEEDSDNHVRIGMDASLFMKTFAWTPSYNMDDMVTEMYEMLKNPQEGEFPISFKLVYNL